MAETQKSAQFPPGGKDHAPTLNNLLQQPANGYPRPPYPGQPWTAGNRPSYPAHPGMPYPPHQGHMMGHMFNSPRMSRPMPMSYNHGASHHEQMQSRPAHPGFPGQSGAPMHPHQQQQQQQGPPRPPSQAALSSPVAAQGTPQAAQQNGSTTTMNPPPAQSPKTMPPASNQMMQSPMARQATPHSQAASPAPPASPMSNGHPPQAPSPAQSSAQTPPMNFAHQSPGPGHPGAPQASAGAPHYMRHPATGQPMPYPHGHPAYRNGYPGPYPPRPGFPPQGYPGYPQVQAGHPYSGHPSQPHNPYRQPFTGMPGQGNPQAVSTHGGTPVSSNATTQAAAQAAAQAAVIEAQAQGMTPRPPFHRGPPGMFPSRPGAPFQATQNGFPPSHPHAGHGQRPGMPSMQPGQPMNSPFARMATPHPGKPAEPKENGPMSPASSLGDDSVNNVNSPQPQRPPSVASSHGSETPTAKKSTAKATLKLAVLYQPDSPERREFIDTVIKFHEDKGQPLKGPPMFNQQPLDLFELYNLVKERGGMNEVTKKKEWTDVVRGLKFQVTPSAGFTLKKQYVKYLFEVECRREHRQIDEAEIRKIVETTTRKRDKRRSKKAEDTVERNTASPGSNPGMTPPPQVMSTGHPTQQGGFPPRFSYPRPPGMPGQYPGWGGQPGYPQVSQHGQPMPQRPPHMGGFPPGMRPGYPTGPYPRPGFGQSPYSMPYRPMRASIPHPPVASPSGPPRRPQPHPQQQPSAPQQAIPQRQAPHQVSLAANSELEQALRPGRKKLNLPAGCVERTEAQPFYRVTSSRSQMEVDFWRHIMMPLKSGLPSETSSALNLLLVLSRDDCTLPQLRLNTLQDLLSLLTSHLRVVLNAILPDKAAQAGVKRTRIAAKPKPLTPEEENLYKINFKEVQQSKLGSKFSKKQVRVKKKKFGRHLLPDEDDQGIRDEDDSFDRIIILPSDTEKTADYVPKWTKPAYRVQRSAHHMLEKDAEKSIEMTSEQEDDFKKLEKLRGWGHEAADLKRRKISLSQETLTAVDDDDTEADYFEIEEDPVLNLAQPPIMLTSRLNCIFAILRNLSFNPQNWKTLAESKEVISLISCFLEREQTLRGRCKRHAAFVLPERFYWDESVIKKKPDKEAAASSKSENLNLNKSINKCNEEVKKEIKQEVTENKKTDTNDNELKIDEEANLKTERKDEEDISESSKIRQTGKKTPEDPREWLVETDEYWTAFFGEFTLIESTHMTPIEVSWKKELIKELTDDAFVFISNVALELKLCEVDEPQPIITFFLNGAAYRAMEHDLPLLTDNVAEPVSTYRLALETLLKLGLNEDNVGMILSTRPFDRLERIVELLFENLNMEGNLLLAEMSIALLHKLLVPETELTNFVQKLPNSIGSLVAFIETLSPDVSSHTKGMACEILAEISKDESSHRLLLQYECKLAQLFSSSIMQPNIHNRIADILFNVSTTTTPNPAGPQDVKMKC